MRRRLMLSGLLVAAITLLGISGTALAWEQVACDHSPTATMGTMGGMMGPGTEYSPGLGGGMGEHMGFFDRPITFMLSLTDRLNLTPEQVVKLESLRGSFQKKAEEGFQALRQQYGELVKIMDADKVDLARAESTLKAIASLESDLTLKRIRVIEEGKSVLTAEQRTIFKELRGEEHCPGMRT